MTIEIRGIKGEDFDAIYELYEGNKTIDLHKWLYAYPNPEEYNGYAAVLEGKICGLIGYTKTTYNVDGEILTGVVPHSFLVDKNQRGIAGLKLLNKVFTDADFFMFIDGTEMSQKIFKIMRFSNVGNAIGATKMLRLGGDFNKRCLKCYAHSLSDNWRVIKSWFKSDKDNFEIVEEQARGQKAVEGVFNNMLHESHLAWLRGNPLHQVKVLTVILDENHQETFVCCLRKKKGKIICQITHHSPLVYDHQMIDRIWTSLEMYLRRLYHVHQTNVLVSSDRLKPFFTNTGYRFEKKQRPIGMKSKTNIENKIKDLDKVLCFSECDESTRNI